MSKKLFAASAEVLFTASALVLLFLVYQLWFSNQLATQNQEALAGEIERSVSQSSPQSFSEPVAGLIELREATGVGLLYIPRLKSEVWGLPIVSGIDDRALSQGVGHYPQSELPGEAGNFALAGHRATNGEPFAYFEKLQRGDMVYVQTDVGWFSYQLVSNQKIQETDVWVLGDDPINLGEQKLLTLTTCDPRWNSTRRWAWWGVQVAHSSNPPIEVTS